MSRRGNNQFNSLFPSGSTAGNPMMHSASAATPSMRDQFEAFSRSVEEIIDTRFKPLRPYVPAIGRAFIIATFYEDSLRIMSQWLEQLYYLHHYRHIWRWFSVVFLLANISVMTVASTLLVLRKKPFAVTLALVGVVVAQGMGYGLIFDPQFILRNLLVVGGLILAFSDAMVTDKRALNIAGLPMLNNNDNKKYYLLAGRLLLVLLFLGFVFSASTSFFRIIIIISGFLACVSIIVGYKTKFFAAVLVVMLFTYNMFVNTFWNFPKDDAARDFLKYEFFQTLSIVGGLLIIVNAGAGELSIDEKKKLS